MPMQRKVEKRYYLSYGILLLVFWSGQSLATPTDPYEEVNKSWERFGAVYGRIVDNYYASLDQDEIMQSAIEGMLRTLDSYSQYYDEEGLRQLRQDTTGKFAGLGITVAIKDQYPMVISPIEGTPADRAGLLSGDLIVGIEGRDTHGMNIEEVVDALRGDPGTQVRIKVAHKAGKTTSREVTITREIIKIKSVTLAEEIQQGIGYIGMRQTRFSEDTTEEVNGALKTLMSKGVRGVILDLRGNPGGLLSQATQVADLFLPKGAPIVSIRERDGRREEVKKSQKRPVAEELPLVVLIDGGSASASEIVAGAIQDNDRGLILGTSSYGKGSVQTIFDLYETEDSALKLTTALYYTPSGRSIHRKTDSGVGRGRSFQLSIGEMSLPVAPTLNIIMRSADVEQAAAGLRVRFDLEERAVDQILATPLGDLVGNTASAVESDAAADSMVEKAFYTRRGRKVYGGGGISPDIEVQADLPPDYVLDLERRRLFFDFVVDYVSTDTTRITSLTQAELEEEMVAQFKEFQRQREATDDHARIAVSRELEALRNLAEEMGWGEAVGESIDRMDRVVEDEIRRGFTSKLDPYIRKALRRELALRLKGRQAQLRASLKKDPQLVEAIDLLVDGERYSQLLAKGGRE